jgi:hypothetical protein
MLRPFLFVRLRQRIDPGSAKHSGVRIQNKLNYFFAAFLAAGFLAAAFLAAGFFAATFLAAGFFAAGFLAAAFLAAGFFAAFFATAMSIS